MAVADEDFLVRPDQHRIGCFAEIAPSAVWSRYLNIVPPVRGWTAKTTILGRPGQTRSEREAIPARNQPRTTSPHRAGLGSRPTTPAEIGDPPIGPSRCATPRAPFPLGRRRFYGSAEGGRTALRAYRWSGGHTSLASALSAAASRSVRECSLHERPAAPFRGPFASLPLTADGCSAAQPRTRSG